jgi:hypothetical protein
MHASKTIIAIESSLSGAAVFVKETFVLRFFLLMLTAKNP